MSARSAYAWIVGLALSLWVASAAMADEGTLWDVLGADDPNESVLAFRLDEAAERLPLGRSATRDGPVVFCSQRGEALRKRRAAELAATLGRGADALRAAGFAPSGEIPPLVVIEVRVAPGQGRVLRSKDAAAILVRTSASRSRGRRFPEPPVRADGPPTVRDVVKTAGEVRMALWDLGGAAKGTGGGPSLDTLLARHLLRWAKAPEALPGWLRVGTTGWLCGSDATNERHVCGKGPTEPRVEHLFAAGKANPVVLARLVAHLASRSGTLPPALRELAGSTDTTPEAFEAAFGLSAADALAEATSVDDAAGATTDSTSACEGGTVACTLCTGTGEVEMACPDCAGLGAIACPSCQGRSRCRAGCYGGKMYYQGGAVVKCSFCGGKAVSKCLACNAKGRARCRSCKSGKVRWPCPTCVAGRLPCPEAGPSPALRKACGEADESPCVWCADATLKRNCTTCGGATYTGCDDCDGCMRLVCDDCGGSGERVVVLSFGSSASIGDCRACRGRGYEKCVACRSGKFACGACKKKKGRGAYRKDDCELCLGEERVPTVRATSDRLREPLRMPTAEENAIGAQMLADAKEFLFDCRDGNGVFCLRDFRPEGAEKGAPPGKLRAATAFSNAFTIWALSSVGITKDDERMKGAWEKLRRQAKWITSGKEKDPQTQATSLVLRALLSGGEPADSDLVKELVALIVKGQRRNGLWASALESEQEGDEFTALFALESLWIARRKGVKISNQVFAKALRGAKRGFDARGIAGMKKDWVTGTSVASNTALVILAQAGKLGKKARGYDFESMPEVRKGFAWLDRYFDIREQPKFSGGARVPSLSDGGSMAYMFTIQRLAMLLNMPVLAGERWHATGTRHLATIRFDDGSFEERTWGRLNGPVRSTANVMMFLARATVPITEHGK